MTEPGTGSSRRLLAVSTWSTLHGLTMFTLDSQVADIAPNVEALVGDDPDHCAVCRVVPDEL